jgi:hypothetical protein
VLGVQVCHTDVGLKPRDVADMPRMLCFDALCVLCKIPDHRGSVPYKIPFVAI